MEILSSLSFCRKRGIISAIIKSTTSKVLLLIGYNSSLRIDLINSCSSSSNIKLLKTQEIQMQEKENISSNHFLKALASVLSVAAQMKEAMLDLEEGSARSQVGLCLYCLCLCFHFTNMDMDVQQN